MEKISILPYYESKYNYWNVISAWYPNQTFKLIFYLFCHKYNQLRLSFLHISDAII